VRFLGKIEEFTQTVAVNRKFNNIVTSRSASEMQLVTNFLLSYTASDIELGIEKFVNQEMAKLKHCPSDQSTRSVIEATNKSGGDIVRARAIVLNTVLVNCVHGSKSVIKHVE